MKHKHECLVDQQFILIKDRSITIIEIIVLQGIVFLKSLFLKEKIFEVHKVKVKNSKGIYEFYNIILHNN